MTPQYLPQIQPVYAEDGTIELVMQVSNFRHRSGGILESLKLGDAAQIIRLRVNRIALDLFLFGSLLIMGLYHIGLFAFRTKETSALYFGFYCVMIALRTVLVGEVYLIHLFPNFSWEAAHKIQTLAYYLGVPLVLSFLRTVFPKDVSGRIHRVITVFGLAFGLLVLLTPARVFTLFNPIFQVFTLTVVMPYVFFVVVRTCHNRRQGSVLIGVGTGTLAVCVLNDVIYLSIVFSDADAHFLRSFVGRGDLSSWGLLVLVLAQSFVLAKQFSESFGNLERVAEELVASLEQLRSEKRLRMMEETLRNATKSITSTLNSQEVPDRLLISLAQSLDLDKAVVFLRTDEELEVVATFGFGQADYRGERYHLDRQQEMRLASQAPFSVGEIPALSQVPVLSAVPGSWLGIPLGSGGNVVGLLALQQRETVGDNKLALEVVPAFAEQAAIAIENAREFHRVNQMATHDGLAGLFSRTHFMELARTRCIQALRDKEPLALLMLDIDDFKIVNDAYGHAVGDELIKAVADRCKLAIPEGDIAGRYGGDEFIFLISGKGTIAGEQLRTSIEEPIPVQGNGSICVTASVGVAALLTEFDVHGEEHDWEETDVNRKLMALIQRADSALYQAKERGRNQVVELVSKEGLD